MAKSKPNPLQAALNAADTETEPAHEPRAAEDAAGRPARRRPAGQATKQAPKPSRAGTVLIGGHFSPMVKQQLKIIAAEENTTSQALLEEALNLLFVKKGKKAIV